MNEKVLLFVWGASSASVLWGLLFLLWYKANLTARKRMSEMIKFSSNFTEASNKAVETMKDLQTSFSDISKLPEAPKVINIFHSKPSKVALSFTTKQCVKITTKEQFNKIRYLIGADEITDSLVDILYLEHRKDKIRFSFTPLNSITGDKYEVVSFEKAVVYE